MATRKRTDLRSRDVPEKKKLKGKPPFGFRFSSFFEGSYSRRSAAVCPFPTADHPPAPECFLRSWWMISPHFPLQSLRTLPFRSNLFFSFRSVNAIVPTIGIHCAIHTIPPVVPTQSFPFPKTQTRAITVGGSITSPLTYQSFPQQRCAYFQVSLFFMDIAVRYPYIPLISFGGFF